MKFYVGDNVRVTKGMCEGELANILRFEGKDNSIVLLEVGEGELMYTTIDSIEKVHKVYNLIELCQIAKNGDKFEDNYGNVYTFFDGELVYDEDDDSVFIEVERGNEFIKNGGELVLNNDYSLISDIYILADILNLVFVKKVN